MRDICIFPHFGTALQPLELQQTKRAWAVDMMWGTLFMLLGPCGAWQCHIPGEATLLRLVGDAFRIVCSSANSTCSSSPSSYLTQQTLSVNGEKG